MKKILTLILAIMLLALTPAFADEAAQIPSVDLGTIEMNYEPTWVAFENGMQIALPSDWAKLDVSDEVAATGVFYLAQNPDATIAMSLAYVNVGVYDLKTLSTLLAMTYPELGIVTVNGVDMIAYDESDGSYSMLITADNLGGMYMMAVAPVVEDEALTMTALSMMSSLGPVDAAAEATEAPAN